MISIIVPVYNSHSYLVTCLDSIRNQTFLDWECILVDDGSIDGSGDIIDQYERIDERFIAIHRSNGGVSSARNVGISRSKGEYVAFVDSDDWIDSRYLEKLYNAIISGDIDLSICGYHKVKQDEIIHSLYTDDSVSFCIDRDNESLFIDLIEQYYFFNPWQKLFRLSIIKDNGIAFNETCSYGEDLLFNFCYLEHVQRVSVINEALYYYRVTGEGSLSRRIRPDWFDINYSQWTVLRRFFEAKFGDYELSKVFLYRRLWGIIYDSVFLYPRLPQRRLNYLKRILSIPEINELRLYDDFPCSKWISVSILNRWFLVFYLYFNLKR